MNFRYIQALKKGKLRSDVEGRYGEIELVEHPEGFVYGADDLVEVLLGIVRR